MESLVIRSFTNKEDAHELKTEDKQLIESIIHCGQSHLSILGLAGNQTWWADTEASALFLDFIRDQTALTELYLTCNYFSSSVTEQVLSALLESCGLATLKEIYLNKSAIFSSDEACYLLAQLLDRAPQLATCDIRD